MTLYTQTQLISRSHFFEEIPEITARIIIEYSIYFSYDFREKFFTLPSSNKKIEFFQLMLDEGSHFLSSDIFELSKGNNSDDVIIVKMLLEKGIEPPSIWHSMNKDLLSIINLANLAHDIYKPNHIINPSIAINEQETEFVASIILNLIMNSFYRREHNPIKSIVDKINLRAENIKTIYPNLYSKLLDYQKQILAEAELLNNSVSQLVKTLLDIDFDYLPAIMSVIQESITDCKKRKNEEKPGEVVSLSDQCLNLIFSDSKLLNQLLLKHLSADGLVEDVTIKNYVERLGKFLHFVYAEEQISFLSQILKQPGKLKQLVLAALAKENLINSDNQMVFREITELLSFVDYETRKYSDANFPNNTKLLRKLFTLTIKSEIYYELDTERRKLELLTKKDELVEIQKQKLSPGETIEEYLTRISDKGFDSIDGEIIKKTRDCWLDERVLKTCQKRSDEIPQYQNPALMEYLENAIQSAPRETPEIIILNQNDGHITSLRIRNVEGDGNCLFRAMSVQILGP